jgi:hypothetical protein
MRYHDLEGVNPMTDVRAVMFLALAALALPGCVDDPARGHDAGTTEARYYDAVTGEDCVPDPGTIAPVNGHNGQGNGNGGHNSPTGIPGDNIDDPHSGKIDCLGDGNSGQGNDSTICCDANNCCN